MQIIIPWFVMDNDFQLLVTAVNHLMATRHFSGYGTKSFQSHLQLNAMCFKRNPAHGEFFFTFKYIKLTRTLCCFPNGMNSPMRF
jgi:hypothetical protein